MKRAPWYVFAGALAGFAGVIGLNSRPAASTALSPAKGQPSGGGARASGAGGSNGTRAGGSGGGGQAQPVASGPAHSATGTLEQYGYGELDVSVTVRGNRITAISVPSLQTAEQYSQQLAAQVIPMLKSQVLQAQSAQINGVSGATYTSEAYAMSLQSALNKLHVK